MPTRPPQFRLPPATFRPPESRPTAQHRGYDSTWRRVREQFLREHPVCALCASRGRTTAATLVDHVRPLQQGGPRLDWMNLRPLCRDCHAAATGNLRSTGINEPRRSS